MDKVLELLKPLKHAAFTFEINKLLIPVTLYNQDEEGKNAWNLIYKAILEDGRYKTLKRTKSGGISKNWKLSDGLRLYDVDVAPACLELTVVHPDGLWRIQFRHDMKEVKIKGRRAFTQFKRMCKETGIDLDTYAIKNGKEVKATIEKPFIKLEKIIFQDQIFENAHHIDFHSSYPAGLVNTHPEFREVVQKCYDLRNHNDFYKAILNFSIGFMQSTGGCHAKYSELARDAIADNNKRILDVADRLDKTGRIVIAYNVDGVWYSGKVYHGEGEGSNFGEWQNDHINCKLRYKSDGIYEYIEDGAYHPVVRGLTALDKVKSRDKWEWGDIYQEDCELLHFFFLPQYGIMTEKDQRQRLKEILENDK